MSIHFVLKFHHEQATDQGPGATIEAQMAVIQKTGKVYWGTRSTVSQSKIEMIIHKSKKVLKHMPFCMPQRCPSP